MDLDGHSFERSRLYGLLLYTFGLQCSQCKPMQRPFEFRGNYASDSHCHFLQDPTNYSSRFSGRKILVDYPYGQHCKIRHLSHHCYSILLLQSRPPQLAWNMDHCLFCLHHLLISLGSQVRLGLALAWLQELAPKEISNFLTQEKLLHSYYSKFCYAFGLDDDSFSQHCSLFRQLSSLNLRHRLHWNHKKRNMEFTEGGEGTFEKL